MDGKLIELSIECVILSRYVKIIETYLTAAALVLLLIVGVFGLAFILFGTYKEDTPHV